MKSLLERLLIVLTLKNKELIISLTCLYICMDMYKHSLDFFKSLYTPVHCMGMSRVL